LKCCAAQSWHEACNKSLRAGVPYEFDVICPELSSRSRPRISGSNLIRGVFT